MARKIPKHYVRAEEVFLLWEGVEYRIPASSPNYDKARFAVYGMRWEEIPPLAEIFNAK